MSNTTASGITAPPRLSLRRRRFTLFTVACLSLCMPISAQLAPIQSHPGAVQSPSDRDQDPFQNREMLQRLQKARETDRQRRIVDDAKRLVELTSQYRKLVEAHGTPTADDQKLLIQIEKLARDVKDRMRGM